MISPSKFERRILLITILMLGSLNFGRCFEFGAQNRQELRDRILQSSIGSVLNHKKLKGIFSDESRQKPLKVSTVKTPPLEMRNAPEIDSEKDHVEGKWSEKPLSLSTVKTPSLVMRNAPETTSEADPVEGQSLQKPLRVSTAKAPPLNMKNAPETDSEKDDVEGKSAENPARVSTVRPPSADVRNAPEADSETDHVVGKSSEKPPLPDMKNAPESTSEPEIAKDVTNPANVNSNLPQDRHESTKD